jgi:hypothetical protein
MIAFGRTGLPTNWKRQQEDRPIVEVLHPCSAALRLSRLTHDAEPEASPFGVGDRLVRAEELLEQPT